MASGVMEAVMKELESHGDILVFPTVRDSLQALTHRTLVSFRYAYKWLDFEYILKCDDDTFVDVRRVATELQLRSSKKPLYWGYMRGGGAVLSLGTYSETHWEICDSYVPYALGGAYVISREVVGVLEVNARHLRLYKCEDVSVGAWLAPYNIELKHDARFNTNSVSRGCKSPYLVSHKVSVEKMFAYQESLVLEGAMCSWRTYSYGYNGYLYNWTAPRTTNCCRKNIYVP